jgi:hypothetical protein
MLTKKCRADAAKAAIPVMGTIYDITDDDFHHLARHGLKARELDHSACRSRNRRDHPRGQRLASPRKQLRWIEPVRARDRRHVRPRRKRFPDDPILLLA